MFKLSDDDKWTILRIATMAVSSGAFYGQKARDQEVKDIMGLPKISTARNKNATCTSENSNMGGSEFRHASQEQMRSLLKTLESDLADIGQGFSAVGEVTKQVSILFRILEYRANMLQCICSDILLAADGSTPFPADQVMPIIQGIAEVVFKLKLNIPRTGHVRVESASDLISHLVKQPAYEEFEGLIALPDFEKNYRSLDSRSKLCLFCFSVFPEGYAVQKTSMMYWWVGEGLVGDKLDGDKVVEEVANEILNKFLEFGFVEPMIAKGKLVGLKMNPVIRYAVAYLAERAGFCDFDFTWNPTTDFHLCGKAFLVKIEGEYSRQLLTEDKRWNPGKLRTLLNVNDHYPNFETKWFSKVRNVNVLSLGLSAVHVPMGPYSCPLNAENTNFLKGLKYMKQLKFLSLRGLEGISLLPDAIGKIKNLRILNLNKCPHLMKLPSNMGSLQRLTHLDFSECYNLDGLPKGIRELKALQVLKGFVISYARFCTLYDLARLKKLRKLSIHTNKEAFPAAQQLNALWYMRSLRKLKISWTRGVPFVFGRNPGVPRILEQSGAMIQELPQDLEKLELEEFPETRAPYWLVPGKLKCLKKLYIRGGNLHNLHQAQGENDKWKVKILRLQFLPEFSMDWTRVEDEFPDLIYVEKDECPQLTSFPCEDSGVWLNNKIPSDNLLKGVGFSWSFLANGTC